MDSQFRTKSVSTVWATIVCAVSMLLCSAPTARADNDRDDERDDEHNAHIDIELEFDATAGPSPSVGGRTPPIADVLDAAYRASGLDQDPAPSWRRRARVAALVPWVTMRAGWNANWRDEATDVGRRRAFEVRATWRLDRLVFDPRELQVASIDTARRRERRRLASRVIRAYFAWRRVSVMAAGNPRYALAAEAATAELDALTDGWFSDHRGVPVRLRSR